MQDQDQDILFLYDVVNFVQLVPLLNFCEIFLRFNMITWQKLLVDSDLLGYMVEKVVGT